MRFLHNVAASIFSDSAPRTNFAASLQVSIPAPSSPTPLPLTMKPPRRPLPPTIIPDPQPTNTGNHVDRSRPYSAPPPPKFASFKPVVIRPDPPTTQTPLSPLINPEKQDFTPRHWNECFDNSTDITLSSRGGVWRIYDAGFTCHSPVVLILLHGGGHSALSWALVARRVKAHCPVIAFDARAHGNSLSEDDDDLSAATQMADAAALIDAFFSQKRPGQELPQLVICGHSMGGAIAVRIAAAQLLPNIVGLIVIDVVEGTAMSALPYMSSWLQARTSSFSSEERAIRYVTKAGHVRNVESARLSVPAQIVFRRDARRWVWRTKLQESEQHWKGWFQGLSPLFLSVPAAKMLVLASVDRLDRDLMIAQMQGKFQSILIPAAGHTVHEDQPDETAQVILQYMHRNMLLSSVEDCGKSPIFQQRSPIPPCR